MTLRKYFFILSSLILSYCGVGQQARVLTRNAPENTLGNQAIQIKWYSDDFPYYTEGVHVYRRESGATNWEKQTVEPVQMKTVFDTGVYQFEPDLSFFTAIMQEANQEEVKNEPFLFVNLLIKSFQSEWFADFLGIFYEDTTVVSGNEYEYRINKIIDGRELLLGISETIKGGKYRPEDPVRAFTVKQIDQKFELDWENDKDQFYAVNVYQRRSDSERELQINEKPLMVSEATDSTGKVGYPTPKYKIDSLDVGIEYSYSLAGLDFFGAETRRTDTISIIFRDEVPPPPPTNLSGKADSLKVRLHWNLSESEDLQEFRLYRSTLSDGPFEVIFSTTSEISYTDTVQIPGPYYYYLAAADHVENEAASRKIFVEVQDVIPPSKPTGFVVRSDTAKLTLQWTSNSEPDLAGYLIYRTVNEAGKRNFVLLNTEPVTDTTFIQLLPKHTKNTFFYQIVAMDTSFNRSVPSDFANGQMPDVLAPERPHIKRVTHELGVTIIEWIRNIDADLMGYDIYRSDSINSSKRVRVNTAIVPGDIVRFVDRTSDSNQIYYYQVVALDSSKNHSEFSLPVYAYRKEKEIRSLSIHADLKLHRRSESVIIKWENPDLPADTMIGYVIYAGDQTESMKPETGLLKQLTYKRRYEERDRRFFQVRGYTKNGDVLKSAILKGSGR